MNRGNLIGLCLFLTVIVPLESQSYVRSSPNGAPVAWALNCLRIYANVDGSEDLTFAALESAIVESMAPWNAVGCTGVELIYEGAIDAASVGFSNEGDNHNIIVFRDDMGEWVYPGDVLGLTTLTFCSAVGGACKFEGQLLDGDIEFNGSEAPFSAEVGSVNEHHDFANTLTHELGHFIGLDHSLVPESTMFASAPIEEIEKRSLSPDDIDGMCAIYSECKASDVCGLCNPSQADNEGDVNSTGGSELGCNCKMMTTAPTRALAALCVLLICASVYPSSRRSRK